MRSRSLDRIENDVVAKFNFKRQTEQGWSERKMRGEREREMERVGRWAG